VRLQAFLVLAIQQPQSGPDITTRHTYTGVACGLTSLMTTGQGFTAEDHTEIMTTNPIDITKETTGSSTESSGSRGSDFYFHCAVVVIGFVGTALNGLILYALVAAKQHKKQPLIFNQNLLDCVGCFFLGTSYIAKLCRIDLNGTHGYWLCLTILSEGSSWGPFMSSMINLLAITVERYLKVVHPVWAKKKLRRWVIFSAAGFAWIGGTVVAVAVTARTAVVVDGVCYTLVFFYSKVAQMVYGIWYFLSFYVIVLVIFTFCYVSIFIAIRRQARVLAGHAAAGSSTAQTQQSKKIKTNIIKTMLLVSVLYAITLTPANIYMFLLNMHVELSYRETGFYTVLFNFQ